MENVVVQDVVAAPKTLRLLVGIFRIVIVVSVVGGAASGLVGRGLIGLGDGAGGIFGVPALMLALVALVLGLPAAVAVARALRPVDGWIGVAVLIVVGAWAVAIGYVVVAHAVDPCANGWWDGRSRIGSQPLCERFGPELNWHTRFHLLAHAVPAAVLFAVYVWALERSPVARWR
jgi:hypothetical protein